MNDHQQPISERIRLHAASLTGMMNEVTASGGLTEDGYARFLSCMVHFTRGVQRHFFTVAGHDSLAKRKSLREFLVRFGLEEESHWQVAMADLRALGREVAVAPVEADLWWAYFDKVVVERPFVRLGATVVLENIGGAMPPMDATFLERPFLRADTTRFYVLHRHQDHPHGEQVMEALLAAKPTDAEWADLLRGAEVGSKLHLGAIRWALLGAHAETAGGAS